FRIFFLSAGVWAVLAVTLWALQVTGLVSLPLAHAPLVWHRHEMLFGFLNPAIAGFLLTAVCVWTNTERLHGSRLFLLWLLWLASRLSAALGGAQGGDLSLVINLAFLPLVAVDAGRRVIAARQ